MSMEKLLTCYGLTHDNFHGENHKLIAAMFVEMVKWVSTLEEKIEAQDARIKQQRTHIRNLESMSCPQKNY